MPRLRRAEREQDRGWARQVLSWQPGRPGTILEPGVETLRAEVSAAVLNAYDRERVGGLRWHLFLGRSQGRDRRCLHDPGAEPDTGLLPQGVQGARVSGPHRLKRTALGREPPPRIARAGEVIE
jgi:hypothetical protein